MNWIKKNWKATAVTALVSIVAVMVYNKFVSGPLSQKVGKDLTA